jgi:enoyl-CoA hydratase/carnithine racemase
MSNEAVQWEVKDGVGTVTLNRPEKRNAVNDQMLEGISNAFSQISLNPEARVILIQGAGSNFSAGIDFNFLAQVGRDDGRAPGILLREQIDMIHSVLNRIEQTEKPVVAKIHGFCGGLGMELALTADFRIAGESATLGVPEIILGLIPDCGGTTRLTRMAGPARAKELIMTGDMFPARKIYEMGLLNQVVPDAQLEEKTREFVDKLLQRPPLALGLAKKAIDWGVGMDKNSHMEIEAYVQSLLITARDFPQTLQKGFAQLLKKK